MNIAATVDITIRVCASNPEDTPNHEPDSPVHLYFDKAARDFFTTRFPLGNTPGTGSRTGKGTRTPGIHRAQPYNTPGTVGIEGVFADLEKFLERRKPMINAQQRKLIHLAKRRIDLADADYRAMLQRVAGVSSSNYLDDASFSAVMDELGRLGFQTVQNAPQYGDRWGWATEPQINYIRSLWRKYAGAEDEVGMRHFLQKHFNVSSLRFLDSATVPKVIVTFKRMAEQRKARSGKKPKPSAA